MLNKIIKQNLKNPSWNQVLCQLSNKLSPVSDNANFEAHEIASFAACKPLSWVLARGSDNVPRLMTKQIDKITSRRLRGEPLYYILGRCEFCGLSIVVDKNVLIPRPETELLVKEVIAGLSLRGAQATKQSPMVSSRPKRRDPFCENDVRDPHVATAPQDDRDRKPLRILDIGTGSGAIAVALGDYCARHDIDAEIIASDISQSALKVARRNISKYKLEKIITTKQSELLDTIDGKFDIITANLPYLTDEQCQGLPDPKLALDGGKDGFDLIAKLLDQIARKKMLNENGIALFEIGHNQGPKFTKKTRELFPGSVIRIIKDINGYPRIGILANN